MTVAVEVVGGILTKLPDRVERAARRCLRFVRQWFDIVSFRDRRAIDLPGVGSVVLVDALGSDTHRIFDVLADAPLLQGKRVVLVTDDPRVHEYRSSPIAAVEYLPADTCADGTSPAAPRIADLRRLYRATHVLRFDDIDTGRI